MISLAIRLCFLIFMVAIRSPILSGSIEAYHEGTDCIGATSASVMIIDAL
jgi:hypothetical protein